jgi:uncharacterized membrane protein
MKQVKQFFSTNKTHEPPSGNLKSEDNRYLFLDLLRGFTVVLMFVFHFTFDLNHFEIIKIDMIASPFWYFLPRLIVFLFLFSSGMGLFIAHSKKIKWKAFNKRLLLISFWALVISVVTYYLYPDNWIYFGTLHAIAVISIVTLFFLNRPNISLGIALILFIPSIFFDYNLPWPDLPHSSWDYISPFPWMGASLLGVFAAHHGFFKWGEKLKGRHSKLIKSLNFLGQHSLIIYLIHQPVFFALIYLSLFVSKVITY